MLEHGLSIGAEVGGFDLIPPVVVLAGPSGVAGSVEHGLSIGAEVGDLDLVPPVVELGGRPGDPVCVEHGHFHLYRSRLLRPHSPGRRT